LFNLTIDFTFLGWMMDETTSRTNEKSCIVYVRYVENYESKTAYYGLLNLDGNGTAINIMKTLTDMWDKDDLHPTKSCWLASDNASTFTGKQYIILLLNLFQ